MADLIDPTPTAEQLAEELRALHDRREREPLSPEDEARYTELWTWWQSGGAAAGAPPPADAEAGADVPQEWLAAFDEEEPQLAPAAHAAPKAAGALEDADLVSQWEEWQANRSRGDPFALIPDDSELPGDASYEELMSARAEVLGSESDVVGLPVEESLASATRQDVRIPAPAREELTREEEPVLPTQAPAPQPTPAPEPSQPLATPPQGGVRVVIHLADGQVRRGHAVDVDVSRPAFSFVAPGGAAESVPRGEARTVFFMRAPGGPPPAPEGAPIRVTLRDGRELSGRSADHVSASDGFTLVPDDSRSSAALVWISRAAVRSVTALD